MNELFEKFKHHGLIFGNKVNKRKIGDLKFAKLLDLTDEIGSLLTKPNIKSSNNIFVHTASLALGGGRDECFAYECRQKKLFELSRYSALYCDKVFISNFMSDYSPQFGHAPSKDSDEFRRDVFDDLKLFLSIKPLIENGMIVPFNPDGHYCINCMSDMVFGPDSYKELKKVTRLLATKILNDVTVKCTKQDISNAVTYSSTEPYFEHFERFQIDGKLSFKLKKYPNIYSSFKNGDIVELSTTLKKKLGYHKDLANEFVGTLLHQLLISEIIDTSFLTHSPIDIKILNDMNISSKSYDNNILLADHLQTIVPFAFDVEIKDLLKLRNREKESFIIFRNTLTQAIKEFSTESPISKKILKEFYADIIEPKLAVLDKKVKEAKKDISKSLVSTLFTGVGIIAFGKYSGFPSNDVYKIAEFLGLAQIFKNSFSRISDLVDYKKSIRDDKYYFLWKVRECGKNKNPFQNILI